MRPCHHAKVAEEAVRVLPHTRAGWTGVIGATITVLAVIVLQHGVSSQAFLPGSRVGVVAAWSVVIAWLGSNAASIVGVTRRDRAVLTVLPLAASLMLLVLEFLMALFAP